jgi:hypothetical protein
MTPFSLPPEHLTKTFRAIGIEMKKKCLAGKKKMLIVVDAGHKITSH